jgi:hypothetical protein
MAGTLNKSWICFIAGFVTAAIIFSVVTGIVYLRNKDREIVQYVEKQMEIEAQREDVINRDPVDFLDEPGVRRAADDARIEFDRKRDEALQRFRDRFAD